MDSKTFNTGDERCPDAVDVVIRQGLPLLATMDGLEESLVLVSFSWIEELHFFYGQFWLRSRIEELRSGSDLKSQITCSGLQHCCGGNLPWKKYVAFNQSNFELIK